MYNYKIPIVISNCSCIYSTIIVKWGCMYKLYIGKCGGRYISILYGYVGYVLNYYTVI